MTKDRFSLGDDHTGADLERIAWIQTTFNRSDYLIYSEGMFYNTHYVEFLKATDATLYRLKWS